ncbi:hybrid sensor histidine kinase/response regulator [Burkholderia plantarii]|uniref:histidine kinase n=1 Tax=Burkholderia plantarii TaxID=41899 RepID=A0A0B6RXK6_BURPL|nr:ATP-binding protein [Burkholderia plantarii]AJK45780.1 sensory box histidine kinase/response regulator [Burkholderia plantarii]
MTQMQSGWIRNGMTSAALVAMATVLQSLLVHYGGPNMPLLLYYPFIAGVAWTVSFGAGLVASLASALLIWLLFVGDPLAYPLSPAMQAMQIGLFLLVSGVVCAVVAAFRHSRLTNDALRRREAAARQQYEAMLASLTQGVIVTDPAGRITYLNPAAAALADLDAGAARGRALTDALHGNDGHGAGTRSTTVLERVLGGGEGSASDLLWLRPAGQAMRIPVAAVASPLRDPDGVRSGAVLVLRDVSADHERATANQMLRRLVDASPDAIIGVGADRLITSWNPAAQRMFGYAEAQALGRDAGMLVAPRWQQRHPLDVAVRDVHDAVAGVDLLCLREDGVRFRATLAASPVFDDENVCVALSLTLRDTGMQRRRERRNHHRLRGARDARRQADTSNRLKDELLAIVSHELRTPLNVIYGWVEVMRNPVAEALQRQAIDAIDRSARSLSRMVADLLDASSLATGKLRLDPMPVDLVRVVADATGSLDTTAAAEGITLETRCALDTCVVSGDAERLRQMLSNLLSNAFKFTPRGGRVTVALVREDTRALLSVTDTGQGVAPEFLPHVFEAFRRAEGSPASPRRGLGLGLSIVRHIAELHGGSARVTSDGTGRGTTFEVALPAGWQPAGALTWASQTTASVPATHERLHLDGQRILLVDDDATSRTSLATALATLGAEIVVAESGRDALARIEAARPTVVLSDLAMPDGDGFWLLDALRGGSYTAAPVLAVTAHAGQADERRVLAAGFDGYLCKPVDIQLLAREILRTTQARGAALPPRVLPPKQALGSRLPD